MSNSVAVIIPAAGEGKRSKLKENKIFFKLDGITVIEKTVSVFLKTENVQRIIIACSEKDEARIKLLFSDERIELVRGGATRFLSVKNALERVDEKLVLVHDAARPFVTERLILDVIKNAAEFGAAVPVLPPTDTLGYGDGEFIKSTGRKNVYSLQTPQGFRTDGLKRAYARATENDGFTDDSGAYAEYEGKVKTVLGERENVKLTNPEDFESLPRVGTGFDLHKLVPDRKLILGGVVIPHDKGLLGHSDADVLAHAVSDAILSALSMRDIGYHFPDDDARYKDADSMKLLGIVLSKSEDAGYAVNNLSACIMAEKPKLKGYVPAIADSLAAALNVPSTAIGLTCTTLEGIGVVGREEGIAVQAYVSLKKI